MPKKTGVPGISKKKEEETGKEKARAVILKSIAKTLRAKLATEKEELKRLTDACYKELRSEHGVSNNHVADSTMEAHDGVCHAAGTKGRVVEKIQEALRKITSGEYGVCAECGQEIPIARLQASPWVNKCVDCKDEEEEETIVRVHGSGQQKRVHHGQSLGSQGGRTGVSKL